MCNCKDNQPTPERKPHIHADVIKAWADGKYVQVSFDGIRWHNIDSYHQPPTFNINDMYRVKPEPKPQTDLEKYGVEVGDVWVTRGRVARYIVTTKSLCDGLHSTLTIGYKTKHSVDCFDLPMCSFEHDTLLFRRGVVNKL